MSNKWELFEIEDHEKINDLLDKRFNELIKVAKNKIENGGDPIVAGCDVRKNMEYLMSSIEGFGASDTEPRAVLVTSICNELGLSLIEKL
ncbi:hypothetical protein A1359_20270 [Methylomonas lenta]|uniref:Uncharacterized protein n=1 Tax=Methylomonas lenta TaxID=980561 RepID=A0A177NS74_9GAMM|nr:hypothetical protein [Methylomonas lenta]OAI20825.1 hypothetical protein A1359_20270 [Methylomonas lenta]